MTTFCVECGALIARGSRCNRHALRNGSDRRWRRARALVLRRDGLRCTAELADGSRCPEMTKLHVDHITPLVDGGAKYDLENLRTLCEAHNLAKGGR